MRARSWMSALAGLASFLVALACCLPVGSMALALGVAGAGTLAGSLRPYFMVLALGLLALGFWQSYRAPRCDVRRNGGGIWILWGSAAIVLVLLLFPQAIASVVADWLPSGGSR